MKYIELVKVYEELDKTTKRLAKTYIIAEFLKKVKKEELNIVALLLQGKLYPNWDETKVGVASKLILKAISTASGIDKDKVEKEWKKTGDLGKVAENLIHGKKQITLSSTDLTIEKVFNNLRKLAGLEGEGTVDKKTLLIAELLTSAKPLEAKYIVKTVLEELRAGIGEGSLRDAIVWAYFGKEAGVNYNEEEKSVDIPDREKYNNYVNAVQKAYDLTNDFSKVAELAKTKGVKGLESSEIVLGKPLKVMLALKVDDMKEGFERVETPAAIEYKYDGFRMQIHKQGDKVTIFTRRLDDVTKQFTEIIPLIKKNVKAKEAILDSEAVGYDPKTGKYLPFQNISQRIKRKYDIERMAKEFPVELNIFDILYYNGKNLINEGFKERRNILEKIIIPIKKKMVLAKQIITSSEKDADKFYKESINAGNEGIMLKNLKAPYKPGARVGYMVKLKPTMETLDLVIVGAEWGEGKRANWLSSFTLACRDSKGEYLEVGKVGSGIKEKEEEGLTFQQLTKELKPYIISEKGKEVKVKPKLVVEVIYNEIQKSPTYSSGYALRFPRVLKLRADRGPKDITTLHTVEKYYKEQKK